MSRLTDLAAFSADGIEVDRACCLPPSLTSLSFQRLSSFPSQVCAPRYDVCSVYATLLAGCCMGEGPSATTGSMRAAPQLPAMPFTAGHSFPWLFGFCLSPDDSPSRPPSLHQPTGPPIHVCR